MEIKNKVDFASSETISMQQLFALSCSESHRHKIIWQKSQPQCAIWRVLECSRTILDDWDCDFKEMGKYDEFFIQCEQMYNNWRWDRMDPLVVEITPIAHNLYNGHHRSFVLGCLLLQKKVNFQPIPVRNIATLAFDSTSETAILLDLSIPEFLKRVKLPFDPSPIGDFPRRLRCSDPCAYENRLFQGYQELDQLRAKGLYLSFEMAISNFTQETEITSPEVSFENAFDKAVEYFVVSPSQSDLALTSAFIFDAAITGHRWAIDALVEMNVRISVNYPVKTA